MTNRFTVKSQEVLENAKKNAEALGHTYIGSEHLLLGILCTECVGAKILSEKGASYDEIRDHVVKIAGSGVFSSFTGAISPKCKRILELSLAFSKKQGSNLVGTEHLLYAICDEADSVGARVLSSIGISIQGIKNDIFSISEALSSVKGRERMEIPNAPTLSMFGKNLNSAAFVGKTDPLIGRRDDVLRLIQILCRRAKNNPCLIGEPGVGKTAIVEGLAQMICDGEVPEELEDKIIVSLDLTSMIAGTKYRGEFEERMRTVLNEAKANPSIILFVDEIHIIMGAGGAEGAIDAANIIKPSLARGELRVIGATTIQEYRKSIERDAALERRFQPILIEEPSVDEAVQILNGLRPRYEAFHKVKIADSAIRAAVGLSVRYINDRFLPDKALDLLDEACAAARMKYFSKSDDIRALESELALCREEKENAILDGDFTLASLCRDKEALLLIDLKKERESYGKKIAESIPEIDEAAISEIITLQTKIPVSHDDGLKSASLKELETSLSRKVIGQEKAIHAISNSIKRGRLGIKNPLRPCASFLFVGPTGVGKTLLAKEIANELFATKDSFIRFDMSEFSEKHSIAKLIGAPAGYVGYEDGGKLTEAVRRHPYSVVLFDEIEKAHPDIYNLLLQILDEGVLTDSQGRRISFKSSIIILTSNIGGGQIVTPRALGFGQSSSSDVQDEIIQDKINSLLKKEFSPEFLNRLDEIIIFRPLDIEDTRKICSLLLSELSERIQGIGIELSFSDAAVDFIVRKGFDKNYGARHLRREIVNHFENTLCEELLNGKIGAGDRVLAHFDGNSISYERLNI